MNLPAHHWVLLTIGIPVGRKQLADSYKQLHIRRILRPAKEAEVTIQGRGQQTCFPASRNNVSQYLHASTKHSTSTGVGRNSTCQ